MAREIEKNGKLYFQCEECKFLYSDREWAEKCEAWCKEHDSCNVEITGHAVSEDLKWGTIYKKDP